jgi:hypothetical protein
VALDIDEPGDLELERVMILTGGCIAALADTIFRLPTRHTCDGVGSHSSALLHFVLSTALVATIGIRHE